MSVKEAMVVETGRRRRRRHSPMFKAEAIGACQQPGVSIAAVAMAHGLNANMLRDWVRKAERSGRPIAMRPTAAIESADSFVPVVIPRPEVDNAIRIEVRRKDRRVIIEWPASAAHECVQLLRELTK